MSDITLWQRRFDRERRARKEAESLLEEKSREAFEANQRLREQAEQTQAIVETAAEGIIGYDQHGVVRTFNAAASEIFQRSQEDVIGTAISDLFENGEAASRALFPRIEKTPASQLATSPLGTRLPIEAVEVEGTRGTHGTRGRFACELAVSRVDSQNGPRFTALVRDLTRRKKLELRLRQAQKMESVGQLAAGIAHEINTPVQFLGDNLQFLRGAFEDLGNLLDRYQELADAVKEQSPTDDLLQAIDAEARGIDLPFLRQEMPAALKQSNEGLEHVAMIVRAMKEFSQPSSAAKTQMDINKTIRNVLAVTAHLYRDCARVEVDLQTPLPNVLGSAGAINQAFQNILCNAAEALSEASKQAQHPTEMGCIRITTSANDQYVEIRIVDNGPGIPVEIQQRVFEPFFTTKEVGKGLGQGLAFVYDVIVEKHHGTILIESTPGNGATVLVRIPCVPKQQVAGDLANLSKGREYAHTIG